MNGLSASLQSLLGEEVEDEHALLEAALGICVQKRQRRWRTRSGFGGAPSGAREEPDQGKAREPSLAAAVARSPQSLKPLDQGTRATQESDRRHDQAL